MSEIFNLKPKGSMISKSELTGTTYHVIKFYTRVKPVRNARGNKQIGLEFIGYEASDKHPLGDCKYCGGVSY